MSLTKLYFESRGDIFQMNHYKITSLIILHHPGKWFLGNNTINMHYLWNTQVSSPPIAIHYKLFSIALSSSLSPEKSVVICALSHINDVQHDDCICMWFMCNLMENNFQNYHNVNSTLWMNKAENLFSFETRTKELILCVNVKMKRSSSHSEFCNYW